MNRMRINIKESDSHVCRNWDRHARVIALLQEKRKTISEMAQTIAEYPQHVSACIWGIPGRRNPRIEQKITTFLGVNYTDLFGGTV
jgi:hypothetical protein